MIPVFSAGSSSLKFGLFDEDRQIFKGSFDRFRENGCDLVFESPGSEPVPHRAQPVPPIHKPEAIAKAVYRAALQAPREVWLAGSAVNCREAGTRLGWRGPAA
ncbi:hypothetical protein ACFSYD_19090 [Paracoccus aerius]